MDFNFRLTTLLIAVNFTLFNGLSFATSQAGAQQSAVTPKNTTAQQVSKGKLFNEIVAIVNDQVITRDELNTEVLKMKAQLQEQPGVTMPDVNILNQEALQQMINQTIALQMAKRQNIKASDAEITTAIDQIIAQNGISLDALKQKLQLSGVGFEAYFNTVKKQLIINKLQQAAIAGKIYIPPAKIDQYISKHFTDKDTLYQVQNILLPLPENADTAAKRALLEKAKDIIQQIQSNAINFTDAAKKYSESTNAATGGELGWKTLTELPSVYTDKIKQMKTGQISEPFTTNNGIQIVYLVDTKTSDSAKHFVDEYKVRKIVINITPVVNDDQAQAKLVRIVTALKNGEPFSTLAKSNSQDHNDADQNGDVGWVPLSQLSPELAAKVKSAKLNQVSLPFRVGNQWQIIEVTDQRQRNDTKDYQQEQATQALFQENAQEALKTWMMSLHDSAYVKILDPLLKIPQ